MATAKINVMTVFKVITSENNHIDIKVKTIIPEANPINLAGHN